MNKGDVLIFHSNILHRSDKNDSNRRRLAFAIAFNTKRNNPTKTHHHPFYNKMEKVLRFNDSSMFHWLLLEVRFIVSLLVEKLPD